mmetsp:Transcript_56518/g.156325  ORF Transcript_56518/g.156325 Transcript_56518/m.156325 type:complete len:89 (-) Transcript_56518:275-541(-)
MSYHPATPPPHHPTTTPPHYPATQYPFHQEEADDMGFQRQPDAAAPGADTPGAAPAAPADGTDPSAAAPPAPPAGGDVGGGEAAPADN